MNTLLYDLEARNLDVQTRKQTSYSIRSCVQALRNGIRRNAYAALEYFACDTRISSFKCASPVSEQEKESFSLIDAGSDLLGALGAGVTMATAYHDVSGLLVGPLAVGIAHTFRYGANLFVNRVLASREKARVGVVYALAAHKIKERLDNGEQLRTDDFFDRDVTDRSKSDEIVEAMLISAQREHEEKKLLYLANLLAFIAFESRVDVGMANYMIKIASSLTYRQYCILALAVNVTHTGLHSAPFSNEQNAATQVWTLLIEIFDLFRLQLVGFGGGFITDVLEMPLERLRLDDFGAYLHVAMKLEKIPSQDTAAIVTLLH